MTLTMQSFDIAICPVVEKKNNNNFNNEIIFDF